LVEDMKLLCDLLAAWIKKVPYFIS
jgi:hypothetical protein